MCKQFPRAENPETTKKKKKERKVLKRSFEIQKKSRKRKERQPKSKSPRIVGESQGFFPLPRPTERDIGRSDEIYPAAGFSRIRQLSKSQSGRPRANEAASFTTTCRLKSLSRLPSSTVSRDSRPLISAPRFTPIGKRRGELEFLARPPGFHSPI